MTKYRSFWAQVGEKFPDLGGAPSTAYYRWDEQSLLREHIGDLDGLKVFKTDLWDEAKNTRILRWAAGAGAEAYGIDISPPIVRRAGEEFRARERRLRAAVADVRALPFASSSFDAAYSMGTVEHFAESEAALQEILRVLKPGGTAIVGVPNRFDPFLRPLLVAVMQRLGIYGFGYEKSFSRRALRTMLEGAGFRVVAESGILFMPGWLRMIDLACHTWARPLSVLSGAALWPFSRLYRHVPVLRRHGYLLATVVRRPR